MKIKLNPELDLGFLKQEFKKNNRLRIQNLVSSESAEYILDGLRNTTAWHLVHTDENANPVQISPAELEKMSPGTYEGIIKKLHMAAPSRYQFIYKYFPIIDAINDGRITEASMLYQVASFFNGTEFMRFARELTDTHSLVKVDTKASLYEAGHFLNAHDDRDPTDLGNGVRRFAIVAGYTKNWSPNWGGQTNFFTGPNDGSFESWNPGFNTLSIFRVPTLHNVSYVVPYAPQGLYGITGWLRDDENVNRPDLD